MVAVRRVWTTSQTGLRNDQTQAGRPWSPATGREFGQDFTHLSRPIKEKGQCSVDEGFYKEEVPTLFPLLDVAENGVAVTAAFRHT